MSNPDYMLTSAAKTLASLGYVYKGGELWVPPVGKRPDFKLSQAPQAPRLNLKLCYPDDLGYPRVQMIDQAVISSVVWAPLAGGSERITLTFDINMPNSGRRLYDSLCCFKSMTVTRLQ